MKKYLAKLVAGIMVSSVVLTGCQGDAKPAAGDTIKIGVFEPLTGANAAGGQLEYDGIKIAQRLYPEVNGKKIELVVADNKSDKVEAANAASNLVDKEKVSAVLGSYGSGNAIAGGDKFKAAGIPAMGTSCSNPQVTAGNEFYFRVCFIDPFQGTVMANYATGKLGAKKAAIFREVSNDYSVGLAKYFADEFKKITGDPNAIVTELEYKTGDQDFSAQLTNLKNAQVDVVFAPGNYTESALINKQARELGITVPFLGGDTWETPQFIETGAQGVEGAVFASAFDEEHPITEESKKFIEEYKKEYPNKSISGLTALGYDSYLIVYRAIEKAGSSDPAAIQKALLETKDFQGATGVINFDSNRDAVKDAVLKQVKEGKFNYLDTIKPLNN